MAPQSLSRFNRSILLLFALLGSLLGSAVHVRPVQAAGMVVNTPADETATNGACSLREAIQNANDDAGTYPDCAAGSGADVITFAGNYTITLQDGPLPAIITEITITGKGPNNTIIQIIPLSAASAYNLFQVGEYSNVGGSLSLNQVSVKNGTSGIWVLGQNSFAVTNSVIAGHYYNGIFASEGTVEVTNSTFSGNRTGLLVDQGNGLTVTGSTFTSNTGGGIWLSRTDATVTNSTFSNNSRPWDGGALSVSSESVVVVTNSTFTANSAAEGGAITAVGHSTLTVENSTFSGNSAAATGGAISTDVGGTLTVSGSTFSANTAANGGGIYLRRSEGASVTGSTFVGNQATTAGGGIRSVESSEVTLANSTFSANTAGTGGGMALVQTGITVVNSTFNANSATTGGGIHGDRTSLRLANTILANSPSGGNCAGGNIDEGNNLDSGVSCRFGSQNGSLSNTNPKLGPLANNGGPTQTHALLPGSPAINAGNATVCGQAFVGSIDQRGVARPQGAGCDIGAYEYNAAVLPEAPTFGDVSKAYWAWEFVERLYGAGITGGCSATPLRYCPEATVTRAQMAIFLLRGIHGSTYNPPAVGTSTGFGDVPTTYWAASWIKQLAAEGITGGCSAGNYCPEAPVTRAQMAIFLLRSKHGAAYTPPGVGSSTGFTDVPSTYWAAAWIKQLVAEGITSGCGTGTYCPEVPVTRAQMAVFLVRTFGLP